VSIVLTTHRAQGLLPTTLESVLAQDLGDWELTVVDDGWSSPSDLARTVEEVTGGDARVRITGGSRVGVARARNRGMFVSRGKYICFLDHDDVWQPSHLGLLVEAAESNPRAVGSYSGVAVVDEDGVVTGQVKTDSCTRESVLSGGARPFITGLLVRTEVAAEVGGFTSQFESAEDLDFVYKVAVAGPLVYTARATASWRRHGGNISADNKEQALSARRVLELHLQAARNRNDRETARLLTINKRVQERWWVEAARREAVVALRRGDLARTRELVAFVAWFNPAGVVSDVLAASRRTLGRRRHPDQG
jgi:glycosyltransferase involved in cell wall biosynthesis